MRDKKKGILLYDWMGALLIISIAFLFILATSSLNAKDSITSLQSENINLKDSHKLFQEREIFLEDDTEETIDTSEVNIQQDTPIASCNDYPNASGTWILTQDIANFGGDCLKILSDDVTLDCQDYKIIGSGFGAGITVQNAFTVTIKNCDIQTFHRGIYFDNVDSSLIQHNSISGSLFGIYLDVSSNNNILHNNFITGNSFGINIDSSSGNTIYNNFLDNPNNAVDNDLNFWNIPREHGLNIVHGSYRGGNYWKDYEGNDTNNDGLGDEPVPHTSWGGIVNGGDNLPIRVVCKRCGDVDGDGMVDIVDLTTLIDHLFINFPRLICMGAADLDDDDNIDIADLTGLIDHLFINFPTLDCDTGNLPKPDLLASNTITPEAQEIKDYCSSTDPESCKQYIVDYLIERDNPKKQTL